MSYFNTTLLSIPAQTGKEEAQTAVVENELLQISSNNDDNHNTRENDPRWNNNFQNATDDTSYKGNTDRGRCLRENIFDANMKRVNVVVFHGFNCYLNLTASNLRWFALHRQPINFVQDQDQSFIINTFCTFNALT